MPPRPSTSTLFTPARALLLAAVLRTVLLLYGLWQDAHSALKYTDIDYLVFTDAARFVSHGASPYDRATYRYTPLLAWLLLPTAWHPGLFAFGKVLFAAADLAAGWLALEILMTNGSGTDEPRGNLGEETAVKYVAAAWWWNPMVANISTRGSAEGVLGLMVVACVWAAMVRRRMDWCGAALGLAVHFKIYPFIYGSALLWWARETGDGARGESEMKPWNKRFWHRRRREIVFWSISTFMVLNVVMYFIYGFPFLEHSYLYHLTRLDHRHNFSFYNALLHLKSSPVGGTSSGLHLERLAFLPQLSLSAFAVPLVLAKHNLPGCMMVQTLAFVTFNKVCTSQYFLWYLVFLPLYLPFSTFTAKPKTGVSALAAWVITQALWLFEGYKLEFLGHQTFVPGLHFAGLAFFVVNCVVLGIAIKDVASITIAPTANGDRDTKTQE